MTSEEIRTSLKPFLDFAPAIIRASEIVEAAELAEKNLKAVEHEKIELEKDISSLKLQVIALTKKTGEARVEHNKAVKQMQDREAQLKSEVIAPLQAQRTALEKEIVAMEQEKNRMIADKNEEIRRDKETLANVRAEIDRIKKQFAA